MNQYNDNRIAFDLYGYAHWWWLRSPGNNTNMVAGISAGGILFLSGDASDEFNGGVRPALVLHLG